MQFVTPRANMNQGRVAEVLRVAGGADVGVAEDGDGEDVGAVPPRGAL